MNGKEIYNFSLPQVLKKSRQFLLLSTDIYGKQSLGAPVFFYLAGISSANSKAKTAEEIGATCSRNFFHCVSYVRFCLQDLSR